MGPPVAKMTPRWLPCLLVSSVFFCLVTLCHGGGKIAVKMIRYQSSCSDNWIFDTPCDTFFYLCIDRPGSVNLNSCDYGRFGPSSHYENTNSMNFGNHVGGISNPMVVSVSRFDSHRVMFVVRVMDHEAVQDHEQVALLHKTVTYTPARDLQSAGWANQYMHSGSYHVWFAIRSYCDAYYYTTECDVYCRPRNDDQGHYSCHPTTGDKQCHPGWEGDDCEVDINECLIGPCFNNASCQNLPGTYSCACPNGFTGQNCDLIDSLCHSAPCQNGGTCTGTMAAYTCTCPPEWEGVNCQTQVDFCQSNPCQNNGTCYATVGTYTCDCALGWNGTNCQVEVDACHSDPCQNGGNCTTLPRAQYVCNCTVDYEGADCQALKNPCDPNPCSNSGTCSKLSHDTYNCSCVYGWEGDTCQDFIQFCDYDPCQNNGTCYQEGQNYTCDCLLGWQGTNCQTQVDACISNPCQNGGSCTMLPRAQYLCTCTEPYEGHNCQREKDPCDPNPCQNSGTCSMVTYDTFNCSCSTGWRGDMCQINPAVTSAAQTGSRVNWLPIFLGCLVALVVVIVVIILLVCRRRRRRKEMQATHLVVADTLDHQHMQRVIGHEANGSIQVSPGFTNVLYETANRNNAMLEQANHHHQQRQQRPVPPTPAASFYDYPEKPGWKGVEEGAVGGVNPYQEVDCTKVKGTGVKGGQPALDTRARAGGSGGGEEGAEGMTPNDYACFEELKRKSMAARQASATAQDATIQPFTEEEENHYHDLDEMSMAFQNPSYSNTTAANHDDPASPGSAGIVSGHPNAEVDPQDSTDEEDEGEAVQQEDLERLRQEVLQRSASRGEN